MAIIPSYNYFFKIQILLVRCNRHRRVRAHTSDLLNSSLVSKLNRNIIYSTKLVVGNSYVYSLYSCHLVLFTNLYVHSRSCKKYIQNNDTYDNESADDNKFSDSNIIPSLLCAPSISPRLS